jgi:DNA modification methylase
MSKIRCGDALTLLKDIPSSSVQCCITSPPYYGLRDYGIPGQIGLEATPEAYIAKLVEVFREVRRVLRHDGTLWVNIGDSYAARLRQAGIEHAGELTQGNRGTIVNGAKPLPGGYKEKDLYGIPWMLAFALRADGWYLRSDIIWHKPNCMPESVEDRPTTAHEHIFLLAKSERYYYDADAIAERAINIGDTRHLRTDNTIDHRVGGHGARLQTGKPQASTRNKRSVWTIPTMPYSAAHFATFPPKLIEPCILAGSRPGDIVLDPFMGTGTVALVAIKYYRDYLGIEINPEYVRLAQERIATVQPVLWEVPA